MEVRLKLFSQHFTQKTRIYLVAKNISFHILISGGSSSATSVTSNSTAETKPSSAILNPLSTQYSPAESPDSTKRRSCVSLGNNSSNSKSSSNLTGSTKSDQGKFGPNSMINQVIKVSA